METRTDYGRLSQEYFPHHFQIAVFLLLLVIVIAIYGGLSQGAIMSLLGFVPLLMSSMKKKKNKEQHRLSFIKKIKPSEEKFEMVDETVICVRDFTLATAKEKRRRKISFSGVFSLFRSKRAPSKDIFTISEEFCEMDDLEKGESANRKGKKTKKEKDPFSPLDQILLSLLNVGMMRKA